jgi:PKD repeat protein
MNKKIISLLIIFTLIFFIFPFTNQAKAQTEPTVSLTPSQTSVSQLQQLIAINITISNVQNLAAWQVYVTWDPTVLNMISPPKEGGFLSDGGAINTQFITSLYSNKSTYTVADAILTTEGVNGSGVLATLQFQVIGQSASTTVYLNDVSLQGPTPNNNGVVGQPATITPTSDSATATVSFVAGGAPAANAGSNQVVTQGSTVTFDGSKSVSTGSNPTYTWSFTDGGTAKTLPGITPTYTFNNPGIYTVTLTLKDSNGSSNSTVIITVQSNSQPVAKITIEGIAQGQSVTAGQSVIFNGSESYEPNNGKIVKYIWKSSQRSGSANVASVSNPADMSEIGSNATISYAFHEEGWYNITLTVFDTTNLNATASTTISVVGSGSSPTPTASSTPTTSPSSTPTATSDTATATPTPNDILQTSSIPPAILAILIIITIAVLVGSTFWLRKRI